MNPVVKHIYEECLALVDGDKAAAASLTLADVMHSVRDNQALLPPSATATAMIESSADRMLNLREAAHYLGYTTHSLRKIVNRSRRSHKGQSIHGPTIEFFQSRPKSTILFRREWLDQFIERHRVLAGVPTQSVKASRRRHSRIDSDAASITRRWASMAAQ